MNETLGTRIKAAIKRAGLTQVEVARRLDLSQQAVNGWANDASEPDATSLARIAEMCGATADELLGIEKVADVRAPESGTQAAIKEALALGGAEGWEGIAKALAQALLLREQEAVIRARDVDAVNASSLHAAIEEARSARRESTAAKEIGPPQGRPAELRERTMHGIISRAGS